MEHHTAFTSAKSLDYVKKHESDFLDLILQRLGIVVHQHQMRDLHKTIIKACEKFNCEPKEYLNFLSDCSYDSPFIEHLISGITIGETYFFRDNHQVQLLQENLLPALINKKRNQSDLSLRIWSAACATGEEIYTIAMIINELLPDYKQWNLKLMGTDINTEALQKAIQGKYSQWSMRSIPDYFKEKYFSRKNNFYFLSPELCSEVNFSYLNLKDDTYPSIYNSTNAQDLILCRNVLIYFDNTGIQQFMHKISKCLVPDGCLILGASDPVFLTDTGLVFRHAQSVYFQKSLMPIECHKSKHEEKLTTILPLKLSAPKPQPPQKAVRPLEPEVISQMLSHSRWQEVLDAIEMQVTPSVFLLIAKATALANLGKLDQAISTCQAVLSLDATNKKAHFVYALILLELNQLATAEDMLRKTLFLDHQFAEGHFQLGLVLLRNKKSEAGLKSLKNALKIAQKQDPTQRVSEFHGLNFQQFTHVLENEIRLYSMTKDVKSET